MTMECGYVCQMWGFIAGAAIGAIIFVQAFTATKKHPVKGPCPQHPGTSTCVCRGDQFGRRDK